MNERFTPILSWIVALLVPFFLILTGLRLLLTPVFPEIEYRMPAFPADEYGFTMQDRLHWSKIAVQYLVNNADITYLSALRFSDGTPVYNERELRHMIDVKRVVKGALNLWYAASGLLILLGLWAWRGKWWPAYRRGLRRGGWITLGIMGAILLFALVSFWNFFVFFHKIFFQGDTWLFLFSDTLIRLFPLRFWQDVFLLEGVLVLGGALGLALGLKPKTN
jgi:integral membrane protein (TIGR01906 family)